MLWRLLKIVPLWKKSSQIKFSSLSLWNTGLKFRRAFPMMTMSLKYRYYAFPRTSIKLLSIISINVAGTFLGCLLDRVVSIWNWVKPDAKLSRKILTFALVHLWCRCYLVTIIGRLKIQVPVVHNNLPLGFITCVLFSVTRDFDCVLLFHLPAFFLFISEFLAYVRKGIIKVLCKRCSHW